MFDVGFWELLMIGVIGLLVVGPERLPEFARTIGKWVGQAQRMVRSVRADIERELETENLRNMINQQEKQIKELKGIVDEVRDDTEASVGVEDLREDLQRTQQELTSAVDEPSGAGEAAAGVATEVDDGPRSPTAATVDAAEADAKKS